MERLELVILGLLVAVVGLALLARVLAAVTVGVFLGWRSYGL